MKISSLNKGLIGQWKLNGNAKDSTPYNNNGTVVGATLTTDRYNSSNKAYSFNGTNTYIDAGNNNIVNLTNVGSISLWANSSTSYPSADTTQLFHGLVTKTSGGSTATLSYYLDWYGTNTTRFLRAGISNGTTNNQVQVSNYDFANKWNLITFTWDGATIILYSNGLEIARTPQIVNAQVLTANLNIGRAFNQNNYIWNGSLDDVRIYNRALTAIEVSQLYNTYGGDYLC